MPPLTRPERIFHTGRKPTIILNRSLGTCRLDEHELATIVQRLEGGIRHVDVAQTKEIVALTLNLLGQVADSHPAAVSGTIDHHRQRYLRQRKGTD